MTTQYSYVKADNSLGTVSANSPQEAIASAPGIARDSGVIAPPIGGSNQTTSSTGGTTTATRTAPVARIDPSTFGTPTFNQYESNRQLTPEETAALSSKYTDQLRDTTDLINAQYAKLTTDQTEANRSAEARAKVLNANTGLIDSGTGATALATTQAKGTAALQNIDAQRTAKIQTSIDQIDQLKNNDLKDAEKQKGVNVDAYNTLKDKNTTKAGDILKTYLAAGGSLDALKSDKQNANDPNEQSSYDALSTALGGEGALQAFAIANAPQNTFISDKPEIVGNKAIWFQKNADGSISQTSVDIPGDKGIKSVTRVPGEGLYVFHNDGTYDVLGNGGTTSTSTGTTATKQNAVDKYTAAFVPGATLPDGTAVVDNNGFITPTAWKQAIDDAPKYGLTRADFIKQFGPKIYTNNGTSVPSSYGLTPVEAKLVIGLPKASTSTGGA